MPIAGVPFSLNRRTVVASNRDPEFLKHTNRLAALIKRLDPIERKLIRDRKKPCLEPDKRFALTLEAEYLQGEARAALDKGLARMAVLRADGCTFKAPRKKQSTSWWDLIPLIDRLEEEAA